MMPIQARRQSLRRGTERSTAVPRPWFTARFTQIYIYNGLGPPIIIYSIICTEGEGEVWKARGLSTSLK